MKNKILVLIPVLAGVLSSCGAHNHYGPDKYFDTIEYTSTEFKVLQLNDIHFGQADDLDRHFKFMDLTINEASPNLIVLNGDTFTYADKRVVKATFKYFNDKNIPWTFTFGNHDDQGYYSDHYIQEILPTYSNCHFVDYDDDISGRGNFAINIKKGGVVRHQIYLMDSHAYRFTDYFGYDYIKDDQIQWYKDMIEYSNGGAGYFSLSNPIIPSSVFFHIPLTEFVDAYEAYQRGEITEGIYIKNESFGSPKYNSGFFDVLKQYGCKAICSAHDHTSISDISYEGVKLCYGLHATDRVYFDEDKLGGMVVSIKDDGDVSIKHIYHTYGEVK